MGDVTSIEWTDYTFSPWEGCEKVSEGCKHCYAEERNARFNPRDGGGASHWGPGSARLLRSENYWKQPLRWDREAFQSKTRPRVFCSSVSDVFEDRRELVPLRARLFRLIDECDHLDWLLLTKRPENMMRLVPPHWAEQWPDHVWAGTTVENQRRANERVPVLLKVPAAVRFLSCEPLLEQIDLSAADPLWAGVRLADGDRWTGTGGKIDWVICGGESGRGARPMREEWVRSLRDQCNAAGVAFLLKQKLDERGRKVSLPMLDGRRHAAFPNAGGSL